MSTLTKLTRIILASLLLLFVVTSCKKQNIQPQPTDLTQTAENDEVSFLTKDGIAKLALRPGPKTGQDVYVVKQEGVGSNNTNYVPELSISEWTVGGAPYHSASYIRFDQLFMVPKTSTVVSAKLYLYTPYSSISTPQGNSGDNVSYVRRVIGSWDESTLTYDNQPAYTKVNQAILPTSTSQFGYNPVIDVTAMVSYFVAHPIKNNGFLISLKTQQTYRSLVFSSSDASNVSLRPKLVVTYH